MRICTDDWRSDLGMNVSEDYHDFHERLQSRLYKLALELLDNIQDVILEDGLWTAGERVEKLADARQRGAKVAIHVFDLSFDEIWRRLQARNLELPHGAIHLSRDDLQKCWDVFEKPSADELAQFDQVHVYNDSDEVSNE